MKSIISVLLLLTSLSVFASTTPGYECTSKEKVDFVGTKIPAFTVKITDIYDAEAVQVEIIVGQGDSKSTYGYVSSLSSGGSDLMEVNTPMGTAIYLNKTAMLANMYMATETFTELIKTTQATGFENAFDLSEPESEMSCVSPVQN